MQRLASAKAGASSWAICPPPNAPKPFHPPRRSRGHPSFYEDALDAMWDSNGFGEEVSLGDFLIAWIGYIEKNTVFAAKQGWI